MHHPDHRLLLITAYAAFNARAIDEALATMHPEVDWPASWEGGRVTGHEAIRTYWLRQWEQLNPRVEPLHIVIDQEGQVIVDIHQVVHDKTGVLLVDEQIQHVYQLDDGLIRRMDIRRQ
jgi:hypothetical protein